MKITRFGGGVFRFGGWVFMAFALPLCLAEIALAAVLLCFGLVMLVLGAACGSYTVIDLQAGSITSYRQLFAHFPVGEWPVAEAAHVTVSEDHGMGAPFLVHIARRKGPILLKECSDYRAARTLAEEVAAFTGLDIFDSRLSGGRLL
jgi:hypothetical protein